MKYNFPYGIEEFMKDYNEDKSTYSYERSK